MGYTLSASSLPIMGPFGKYQLVRRIGAGGMAEVFLARTAVAQGLSKELVIKKIHPEHARSQRFVSMFVAEAEIALGLNHPNIVQVFDFGKVDGSFFLAMEHIDGLDLVHLLAATGRAQRPLPFELAAYIVQETARGLDYAHRKTDDFGAPLGIVHRDVSPQNVLVSWDGAVKIVDFGVARARGIDEDTGVLKGKYRYMSPEQARGEDVDRRSDVFSAGVVLFELCCGRPLFLGQGKEALAQVRSGAIVRPREVNPAIPATLEEVLLEALAFHPDDRFQSARDLQSALGRFLLERARDTGRLVDESVLAQFLSEVVPVAARGMDPAPALAGGTEVPAGPRADAARLGTMETGPAGETPAPAPVATAHEQHERKHVLVVAGRMRGHGGADAGTGPHDARWQADWTQVVRDIAFKHHAWVHAIDEQEGPGQEGLAVGAFALVLGVPVSAEDDPERAIQMAMALVEAADALGRERGTALRLAVGIQRGMAMVRRAGSAPRAAGDHVSLLAWTTEVATHLAERAEDGEILVSGGVHQVTRSEWRFAEAGAADVSRAGAPGASVPEYRTRVYRLLGPKHRAERLRDHRAQQGDPIGRALELKALRDAYRDVLVRRSKRYVMLAGDIGVGKRALVNAFARGIPQGEAMVLRAVTRVSTAYTPYAVIADLARDFLGLDESATPAQVSESLARVAAVLYPEPGEPREARQVADAMHMLLTGTERISSTRPAPGGQGALAGGSDGHAGPGPAGAERGASGPDGATDEVALDADERRHRVWQAMVRLEQRVAPDRPLVVIVEDAHWSDDESLALFRRFFAMKTQRPVLGLLTSRPDARVARVASEIEADIIRVEELDPESAMAVITRRFVPGADTGEVRELARQIVARTGGNPFFIREVLDSLRERGVVEEVTTDTGARPLRWVDRSAPLGVPSSVETFLATRIDALPPGQRQALLGAAVLGRACRADALAHLLERPAGAELEALSHRGLLALREGRYTFANDMIMSVAYGLLPAEERTRLHRRAAARLADPAHYREGHDDAVIARHLELAGDAAAAADRYLAAAAHAAHVGGNGDALRQLGRALKLLPADAHARRFQAHAQREEILGRLGRKPEQLRDIQSMAGAAEALADDARLALAHARLAALHIASGDAAAAARAAVPALRHARRADAPLAEAEALALHAAIAERTGRSAEALDLVQSALALCDDSAAGLEERGRILNIRGTALWHMGRLEEAIESYAEGLVIYRHLHRPRQEAQALNNMGNIFAAMGEFEDALSHYKRSLKLTQRLGDRASIAPKLSNIGQTYADVGDVARAERYLGRALDLAEELGDVPTSTDAAISLGQVALARGRHDEAVSLFERGLALARQGENRYMEIRARIYLAWAQVEAGHDVDAALALARTATEQAEAMPMPVGQIYGLAVQGLALGALGHALEAAEASERAVSVQADMERPEGAEQILHVHAHLCEAADRRAEAIAATRQARREIDAKAARLRDPALRALYLESRIPAAVRAAHARLGAPAGEEAS